MTLDAPAERLLDLLGLELQDIASLSYQTLQRDGHTLIHAVAEPAVLAVILPVAGNEPPDFLEPLVRELRQERDSRGLSRLVLLLAAPDPDAIEFETRRRFREGLLPEPEARPARDDAPQPEPDPAAELRLVDLATLQSLG